MTRIDRLYMDNLSEFIFDDKKVVTFKLLSCTLGVHVNIAKQMLFHFHNANKDAKRKVYATYYISGTAPQGMVMDPSLPANQNADLPEDQVPVGYVVALCKERDLDLVKQRFNQIHSVHIYALSSFQLDNLDLLRKAMRDPVYQERNPVDFGSISCKAALEVRENESRLAGPQLQDTDQVKSQSTAPLKKDDAKSQPVSSTFFKSSNNDKQNSANVSSNKKSLSSDNGKKSTNQGGNRLKNMFATAATKPSHDKPNTTEKIDAEVSSETNQDSNSKQQQRSKAKVTKKQEKQIVSGGSNNDVQSRKRKRIKPIKDVLSSSSEDEREKASDDDFQDYGLPESPIPRKRNLIESDSDEEVAEVAKKSRAEDVVEEKLGTGRRKVSKTVSKTFMDKDGFLVTTKEQVMVSEPETSDTETAQAQQPNESTKDHIGEQKKDRDHGTEAKAAEKKNPKTVNPVIPTVTKSKQSSLMSFFQKK